MAGLHMALVTNCDPWTFLGERPVSPTPQASFDASLDVYARTRMGAAGILLSAGRMIAAPRRAAGRRGFGSRLEHDLTAFSLHADRPLPFQVDGDALEERQLVRFRSVPEGSRGVCLTRCQPTL